MVSLANRMPCAQRLVHPLTWVMFTGGLVSTCQVLPSVVRSNSVHSPWPLKQFAVPNAHPWVAPTKVTSVTLNPLPPFGAGGPATVVSVTVCVGPPVTEGVGAGAEGETAGTCRSALW